MSTITLFLTSLALASATPTGLTPLVKAAPLATVAPSLAGVVATLATVVLDASQTMAPADTNARALNTSENVSGGTVEACQCFCGTAIMNGAAEIDSSNCNMACPQASSEICGGPNALSLYTIIPVWQDIGCYSDTTLKRTLSQSYNVAGLTVEKCQGVCQDNGYIYAGLEFGNQCFCDNSIDNGASLTSGCGNVCSGDSAEICGGANALSMYYLFE
ncbi:hypothetical protein Plec18170_004465 [Paecilomyces lecythidis]